MKRVMIFLFSLLILGVFSGCQDEKTSKNVYDQTKDVEKEDTETVVSEKIIEEAKVKLINFAPKITHKRIYEINEITVMKLDEKENKSEIEDIITRTTGISKKLKKTDTLLTYEIVNKTDGSKDLFYAVIDHSDNDTIYIGSYHKKHEVFSKDQIREARQAVYNMVENVAKGHFWIIDDEIGYVETEDMKTYLKEHAIGNITDFQLTDIVVKIDFIVPNKDRTIWNRYKRFGVINTESQEILFFCGEDLGDVNYKDFGFTDEEVFSKDKENQ